MKSKKGKKKNKFKIERILIIVGIILVIGVLGIVFRDSIASFLTGNAVANVDVEKAIIISHQMFINENSDLIVSGIVKNTAGKELEYIEVLVKFYDAERNVLRTTTESISNLGKDERWKFESIYPSFDTSKVADYNVRLGEIW
jgi:hypothetical protein